MNLRTAIALSLKTDVLKVNKTKIWMPFRAEQKTDVTGLLEENKPEFLKIDGERKVCEEA